MWPRLAARRASSWSTIFQGVAQPLRLTGDSRQRVGRIPCLPLIPESIGRPREFRICFATSAVSGRVAMHHRYLRLADAKGGRMIGLAADVDGPDWRPSQENRRLPAKGLPEPVQRSRIPCFAHSIEIHELPPDGLQIDDAGHVNERPVRLSTLRIRSFQDGLERLSTPGVLWCSVTPRVSFMSDSDVVYSRSPRKGTTHNFSPHAAMNNIPLPPTRTHTVIRTTPNCSDRCARGLRRAAFFFLSPTTAGIARDMARNTTASSSFIAQSANTRSSLLSPNCSRNVLVSCESG